MLKFYYLVLTNVKRVVGQLSTQELPVSAVTNHAATLMTEACRNARNDEIRYDANEDYMPERDDRIITETLAFLDCGV